MVYCTTNRSYSTSPESALKVGEEPVGLVPLHLPVLDGGPAQEVVQLHRLVGGDGGLVLGRLLAQPEVDVLLQAAASSCLDLRSNKTAALMAF